MTVRKRLAILATSSVMVFTFGQVAGLAGSAAVASGSRPVWVKHPAAVSANKTRVIKLRRPTSSVCTLRITNPHGAYRHWTYARGSATLAFAIRPTTATTPGRWTFKAACVRSGTTHVTTATTRLRVITKRHGHGFLVSKRGPSFITPLGHGRVSPPKNLPVGGRGGDPGNDYPWASRGQDSGLDPWKEYFRECTSFVAWALHSRNQFDMPFYDNAYMWGIRAKALGYRVDNSPAIGAVAWEPQLPGHYWGHVAWVSGVSGGNVTIEEYNEHGNGTYDTRTVSASAFQYIHFKDLTYTPPTAPPPPTSPPPTTPTAAETTGSVAHTWTNYTNAGGTEGASIGSNQTVQVACKVTGFRVADGNTWWYRVASSPWNSQYYVSADAFYNNGATSGSLHGTPFVDTAVPDC